MDIVERLRAEYSEGWAGDCVTEAADLIEEARRALEWALAEAEGSIQYESVVQHAMAKIEAQATLAKLTPSGKGE